MQEFQCVVCKLKYKNEATAKQCFEWCSHHNSCSYHIAKQAINKEEVGREPLDDERFNPNQLNK